jgi:hypothetical protein
MKRWLLRGLVAIVVWGATIGFAVFTEHHPHPIALGGAVAATLTVVWLVTDAFVSAEPAQWSLYRAPAPARTFDPRFSRLAQELDEASDRRSASLAVHTSLSAVADRILLDRYDVDRVNDPDASREILGEQVWTYLGTNPRNEKVVFTPALFDVLDRLESL